MLVAGIIFGCSLLGIIALFALKSWELSHERVLAPEMRRRGDIRAMQIKDLIFAARKDFENLLPRVVVIALYAIHEAALGFAALARMLEREAHRLADMVSHKRGFERRETRSEFLKKVAEHKENGLE